MREVVRAALINIAGRFSDDAPLIDERVLRARYPALEAWPADAELGLAVLAWALGPGFTVRGFRESVNSVEPDFRRAAQSIGIGSNPTLIALGGISRCALLNGAIVVRWNLDPNILYWPVGLGHLAGATTT